MPNDLHTVPVTVFKGVSTAREKLFAEAGIHSVHDLLNYYPRAYENRGNVKEVFAAVDGETASFLLTVTTPLTNARLKSKTGRPLSVQRFAAAEATHCWKISSARRSGSQADRISAFTARWNARWMKPAKSPTHRKPLRSFRARGKIRRFAEASEKSPAKTSRLCTSCTAS